MRVLHVAESIKGGCGTYLDQIVPQQMISGTIADVRVIVPDEHVDQLKRVPMEQVATFAGSRSLGAFAALARTVQREVMTFRPDVVHLHSTFAGLIARPLLAAGGKRPRVVYCAHGWAFDMDRSGWKLKAVALAERALAPLADSIVAISDYERQRGIDVGIAPARIVRVWNGLAEQAPPPLPSPVPGRPRRLLFIGRLDRQKGYDLLLEAVSPLVGVVELRMVGASVVGDQGGELAVPANVTMLGWQGQDRIAQELAWADIIVVPSRWEGFGLVALEAMRAGRAVVATRVGGLPEVVVDGETGRLVASDDAIALRNAIVGLTNDGLVAMGQAGRERFGRFFTIDRTVKGLDAVYRAPA